MKTTRVRNFRQYAASRRAAFSLVELIVVMVIIGMLAGLVAVRTRSYLIASKQSIAKVQIKSIVAALDSYYADQSRYPSNDEGLEVLTEGTQSFPEPFLPKIPRDPWKRAYQYVCPGRDSAFEVICLGADGKEGGEGGDSDITSENLGNDE